MKPIKQLATGALLLVSAFFLLAGASAPMNEKLDKTKQMDRAMVGLLLGLPLAAAGVITNRSVLKQTIEEERARIYSIFYRLLRKNNGHVTVLQLAMEAKLPGEMAEEFLTEKVKEFNADLNVTDTGDIVYFFNINPLAKKAPQWQIHL